MQRILTSLAVLVKRSTFDTHVPKCTSLFPNAFGPSHAWHDVAPRAFPNENWTRLNLPKEAFVIEERNERNYTARDCVQVVRVDCGLTKANVKIPQKTHTLENFLQRGAPAGDFGLDIRARPLAPIAPFMHDCSLSQEWQDEGKESGKSDQGNSKRLCCRGDLNPLKAIRAARCRRLLPDRTDAIVCRAVPISKDPKTPDLWRKVVRPVSLVSSPPSR